MIPALETARARADTSPARRAFGATTSTGSRIVGKRRGGKLHWPKLSSRLALWLLKSQLLTVFLILFGLGFWTGTRVRPEPGTVPYDELFENLTVASYREAPSDSSARFVIELSSGGRVFREYDIDARRFVTPVRGHDYRRSINSTRYRPLEVRGHVGRGFWLEIPNASGRTLLPDQFTELYRSTLDYIRPISLASNVLGTLSGYSIGYRAATWGSSLGNPTIEERLLATRNIGRVLAHEAWRRVLLEPVMMDDDNDAGRFAAVRGTQRIYTNFFKLALNDSDGFIPREAARLDSAGFGREARAMRAFARSAVRAAQDTTELSSADFTAIEEWASLLDRRGHWAPAATPPAGEPRMRYLGTLAWYGLAPAAPDEHRIWVGPRVLVQEGDVKGFIADDIPLTPAGCPSAWRPWIRSDAATLQSTVWTARWVGASRELAPLVQYGRGVVQNWQARH